MKNRAKLCGAPKGKEHHQILLILSLSSEIPSDMKNKKEISRKSQRTEIRFYDTPISQHLKYLREEVSVNLIFPTPFFKQRSLSLSCFFIELSLECLFQVLNLPHLFALCFLFLCLNFLWHSHHLPLME